MKRILITGSSGFIGSFMVEEALSRGYDVWAAVRPSSSKKYLQDERIHFFEINLADEADLKKRLSEVEPFDAVIHAAGATKCRRREDFRRVNTDGTRNLARALVETERLKGRFVFMSSLSIFGPIHEDNYAPITDADTPQPNTAYGESKVAAEQALAEIDGLDYVVLRPTGVYGPREKDYFLMAKSIKQHVDFAVGFKRQIITFVYVKDVVQAALLAIDRGPSRRAYFLSDGGEYDSRAFSDLLQKEMGVRGVFHIKAPLWVLRAVCAVSEKVGKIFGKTPTLNLDKYRILRQRNWTCDIAPARNLLGYSPEYPLERGVHEAVAWYKKNNWL